MVEDAAQSLQWIETERVHAQKTMPLVEPIGNGMARVHLSACKNISSQTLNRVFVQNSSKARGSANEFYDALNILNDLIQSGRTPFVRADAEAYLREYLRGGIRAVSHSDAFHASYRPAYRVMPEQYARLLELLSRLDGLLAAGRRVVLAIDGQCAAGKTTTAESLREWYACEVIPMDAFFLPPHMKTDARRAEIGGNIHYERFIEEVGAGLCRGGAFAYRPYACAQQALLAPVMVSSVPLVIVEGSYSLHEKLRHLYDVTVCMEIDSQTQYERLALRENADSLARFQSTWIPLENAYFEANDCKAFCDFSIRT